MAACELVNSFFVPEVAKRTDGQVQFVISSFPELGIAGGDTLRLVEDNTLEVAEVYSGYVGGDLPLLDIGNLWGLSPSEEAHLELSDAIHEDLVRVLKETTGGQPIMRHYYPNQFIFSRDELDSLSQFEGKQIRQHSTILGDLLAGLGAEGQFVAFADVLHCPRARRPRRRRYRRRTRPQPALVRGHGLPVRSHHRLRRRGLLHHGQ